MSNGFTVNSLAVSYADRQLAHQNLEAPQRALLRKRIEYDFKVTGFNVATAATIVTLALAILTSSVLVLALWAMIYNVRRSFMRSVEQTAMIGPDQGPLDPAVLQRIANFNPARRRDEIAADLEINDENWQVIQYQLFDFKAWMNWTPANRPIQVQQPVGGAEQPLLVEENLLVQE